MLDTDERSSTTGEWPRPLTGRRDVFEEVTLPMLKDMKFALTLRMSTLLCYIIRLYSWTFRFTVENEESWMDHWKSGGMVLLCVWHQQFFSAIKYFKSYESLGPSLMISKSRDGELIARVAQKQGWYTVRGSSSRDGRRALKEMIARIKTSRFAAHIVDGPRGPAGIVKPGAISLARASGAMIVPFYTSADRAWYFNSWDRFMLPKPFARVTLRFGDPLPCPADEEQSFESQREHLEAIMRPSLIDGPGRKD